MKVSVEVKEVNYNVLCKALEDFSNVLNRHLVSSGNKITLFEGRDEFGSRGSGIKYEYIVRASIEWERILIENK